MRYECEIITNKFSETICGLANAISSLGPVGVLGSAFGDLHELQANLAGSHFGETPFEEELFFPSKNIDIVIKFISQHNIRDFFLTFLDSEEQYEQLDNSGYQESGEKDKTAWILSCERMEKHEFLGEARNAKIDRGSWLVAYDMENVFFSELAFVDSDFSSATISENKIASGHQKVLGLLSNFF